MNDLISKYLEEDKKVDFGDNGKRENSNR